MKRFIPVLLVGLVVTSGGLLAQGRRGAPPPPPPLEPGASQADVDLAVMAAPARLRDQATVIKWNPSDWTYTTLRKGTNSVVCFDKSGLPGQLPFSVECTMMGNMARVTQNMRFESITDRDKRQAAIMAAEQDGSREKPEYGTVWYHLMGPSREAAFSHQTIAVPGATTASTGLPENGQGGGIWIMNAGTSTAHIMLPGQ